MCEGHNVQSEVFTLRGSRRGCGLHSASLVFTVVLLSHSQICILNRILKLLQCRRVPLISVFFSLCHRHVRVCEQLNKLFLLKFRAGKKKSRPVPPVGPDCLCHLLIISPTSVNWSFQEMDLYFSEFGEKQGYCVRRSHPIISVFLEREHIDIGIYAPLLFWHSAETCLCDEMVMSGLVLPNPPGGSHSFCLLTDWLQNRKTSAQPEHKKHTSSYFKLCMKFFNAFCTLSAWWTDGYGNAWQNGVGWLFSGRNNLCFLFWGGIYLELLRLVD